jgi:hypothetical protein
LSLGDGNLRWDLFEPVQENFGEFLLQSDLEERLKLLISQLHVTRGEMSEAAIDRKVAHIPFTWIFSGESQASSWSCPIYPSVHFITTFTEAERNDV